MSTRDRRALFLSLLVTAIGVAMLRVYMVRFEKLESGGPKHPIVVLTRDLAAGQPLTEDALGERLLPEAYLESRHIESPERAQIIGTRTAVATRAGEALLWSDLETIRGADRRLSTVVPQGMRAFSLRGERQALHDLLVPGDRVDVVSPSAPDASSDIAQNLLVLAVGRDLGEASERGGGRRSGDTVTLAVTWDQGQRLARAERSSPLRLLLRNPEDLALTRARVATDEASVATGGD